MKSVVTFIGFIGFAMVFSELYGQAGLNDIDFDRIGQNNVRKLIRDQMSAGVVQFSDLDASLGPDDDFSEFERFNKKFIIKQAPEVVWKIYGSVDQTELWESKRMAFGLLYSRKRQKIVCADEHFYDMEEKQVYFLNLKLLGGLYQLPVAFEITKIDGTNNIIELSYLNGGKAQGKQVIRFIETAEGYTEINHTSFVHSASKFRDRILYPFFHNKIIREFHANMRRAIKERLKYGAGQLAEYK